MKFDIPALIPLKGHSNYYRKNLVFVNQDNQWYNYKLDLEIPIISIHGNLEEPIAIDVDGGPLMSLGFKINGLILEKILNNNGIILQFIKDETNSK